VSVPAKILIVDDEPDVLASTAMVVRHLGHDCITVSDPAQILDTVEREKPDLVLQDLRMPGLNISGLVASLRTNPATADVPLVFFSANEDVATTAARYDAWGYLAKPFGADELGHLIRQVLSARRGVQPPDAEFAGEVRREVRRAFHEHWNLLAAFGNYLSILERVPDFDPEARKALHGLEETLLKLESRTDRLRSFVLALPVGSTSESPAAREPLRR
jgi:CheY-like chemotaxis protein